jgi:iron complex outermembrane receptor protein
VAAAGAQSNASSFKKLSIQELMDVEITSVSRQVEKLNEAASAVQVVSGNDIRRSGATSFAEALRLAPNLQVAQVNASQWAISARGFNNVLANKLLVLVDGRTVYTPLYAGVYWDVQDSLMEDIDRIEVISGPGGTLWGANAVNGVINLISKSSADTQGLFAEAALGSELERTGAIRYGGEIASNLHYRVYAKSTERDSTLSLDGSDARDDWTMNQGGFRMDWDATEADLLTFQGDLYQARPNPDGATAVHARGQNLLGRWTHRSSEKSDLQLQGYYDHTWRDFRNGFTEALTTWDFDGQHRFPLGDRHEIIWGLGARLMQHKVTNLELFRFEPARRDLSLYSAFIQDEVTLIEDRLHVIVGSKVEHNDFTGYEVQPSARIAWTPTARQTVWAAVSRAVRTPARIDQDFVLKITPEIGLISGSHDFQSEKLLAEELGWRVQPSDTLSASLSLFYNRYYDLRTAEPGPPPFNLPITFGNGVEGWTAGAELALTWQCQPWWKIRGGYTRLKKDLSIKPGSHDLNHGTVESDDPENQIVLQSSLDLPCHVSVDTVFRYMDRLPAPHVPSYIEADLNIAWRPVDQWEISVTGQNLLDARHPEFAPASPEPREVERGYYVKAGFRW